MPGTLACPEVFDSLKKIFTAAFRVVTVFLLCQRPPKGDRVFALEKIGLTYV